MVLLRRMVLLETNAMYGAIVDEVYVRDVAIALASDEVVTSIDDARRPLRVTV